MPKKLLEADVAVKPKRTPGLVPLQQQMYGAMAERLLGAPATAEDLRQSREGRPMVLKDGELPRPTGNNFYGESRYFYVPPKETAVPRCTCNVLCGLGNVTPALATRKCYSCVPYDARRLGLYCEECFAERHPWHRFPHTWLPCSAAEDLDEAAKVNLQRYIASRISLLGRHSLFARCTCPHTKTHVAHWSRGSACAPSSTTAWAQLRTS